MKVIDDNSKNLHWWNRNYLFLGTLIVIAFNIAIFAFDVDFGVSLKTGDLWDSPLNFNNILAHFLSAFLHFNWQHVLLNMLCFLFVGSYVERKVGSFNLIALVLVFALIVECFVGANNLGGSAGYSGVNYAFYAYIYVDFFFSINKNKKHVGNLVYGTFILFAIYVMMCFNGGTETFSFEWYPYDLIYNMGHYSAFLAGIVLAFILKIAKLQDRKELKEES